MSSKSARQLNRGGDYRISSFQMIGTNRTYTRRWGVCASLDILCEIQIWTQEWAAV